MGIFDRRVSTLEAPVTDVVNMKKMGTMIALRITLRKRRLLNLQ